MASFCQKSSVLFHPTAKERKINMFRSIIRCKVYFETHVKCMCKKACAGIVALRAVLGHNQIGVYDDVKQIFKMAPTPRKTKKGTSRHFATPRSAFFPQYFKSCDLRQWGISDVKKNGVRWTFVRSLELKRLKTSVSAQQSAWQGAKKSKQRRCQILILGNFLFEIYLLMVVCLV